MRVNMTEFVVVVDMLVCELCWAGPCFCAVSREHHGPLCVHPRMCCYHPCKLLHSEPYLLVFVNFSVAAMHIDFCYV